MSARVLIVDDEAGILKAFTHILKRAGYEVVTAQGYEQAVSELDKGGLDLVLTDIMLKGRSGVEVLTACRAADRTLPVVMITGQPSVETASQAVRLGAFDYVSKPVQRDSLLVVAGRAIEHGELLRNKEELEARLREREENFSALFNAITESALLLDREGRLLAINEIGAQRLGVSAEEAAGREMEELLPESVVSVRWEHIREVIETGRPVRTRDSRHGMTFDMTLYPVFGVGEEVERIAVFSRDITESLRSEEALRESEREKERIQQGLEAVFRSIPEAIFTVGEDLVVRQANHGVAPLSGTMHPVAQGVVLAGPENTLAGECARLARYTLTTNKQVKEYRVTLKAEDRELVAVINTAPLLDEQGLPIGAVLAVRDITRLADLEERLRERQGFGDIVGRSELMQEVYERISQLAGVDSTVLIIGESGTGKELVANAIHHRGDRGTGPLIKVNCAALSDNLLDSELFGHVRGAFTSAVKDRVGRIQAAEGGTLFLDEIGDISPRTQQRLLRFLESREYERLGESRTRTANVRLVAATNADLPAKVAAGEFREDLYYRLKVMIVSLPSLRERKEDIRLLAEHFVSQFSEAFNKNLQGVSQEVLEVLLAHSWPGNVRELKHTLEHACILCPGDVVGLEHLPTEMRDPAVSREHPASTHARARSTDHDALIRALEENRWNKAKAARALGISRGTLYNKLKQFGIDA